MSNSLEKLKIQAAEVFHRVFDFAFPWVFARRGGDGELRTNIGIIGLLSGLVAAGVMTHNMNNDLDDTLAAKAATSFKTATAQDALRVGLPKQCGGGDYYIAFGDDGYSFYKADARGAKALSLGGQYEAVDQIDSCLNKMANGAYDLTKDFKLASDVKLSAPILVSYTADMPSVAREMQGVFAGVSQNEFVTYTDMIEDPAALPEATSLLQMIWKEGVYNKLKPTKLTTYIDAQNAPTVAAKGLERVHYDRMGDGGVLAFGFGSLLGLGMLYSGIAGSGQYYRKRRQERQEKLQSLA